MKELQKKHRMRRWAYSLPMLALLLVLAGLFINGAKGVVSKQLESARHVRELEGKASALALRNQDLKENISLLNTEEGVEKEIREKYNVSREGEHVVIIIDEPGSETTSTTPQKNSWFKRIWSGIMPK